MKAERSSPTPRWICSQTKLVALAALLAAVTGAHAALPPDPAVELLFSEGPGGGAGLTTTNQGVLGGTAVFSELAGSSGLPAFSTNVPTGLYVPGANGFSVDLGTFVPGAEGRAVDLTNTVAPPGDGRLLALPQLTVCGWVNARAFSVRNQIAYALETPGGLGFSLAANSVGKLGLGINQNSANAPASVFAVPADSGAGSNNWVFVAATYDPALGSNQLKYYYGRPDKLAVMDSAFDYAGGGVTNIVELTGPLSVGNQSPADAAPRDTTSNAGNTLFRGLIDELKVYTNAFTLDQVQQAQLNAPVTPVAASILRQPVNRTAPEGQNATFDVDATGSGLVTYQWKTNGVDVPGATNASFTLTAVTLAQIGTLVRVGVSNAVGGVLSSNATLAVVPANPHLAYISFVEGDAKTTNFMISSASQDLNTTNVGVLQGRGHFRQQNTGSLLAGVYPVFNTNVPTGPYAPGPGYNQFALDMGGVVYTNNPRGLLTSSQGNRAVDFTNSVGSPVNTLGKLSALTICGWLNAGSLTFRGNNGGMGSQIVFAEDEPGRNGFALSHKADWTLQLNVNEWPGGALNRSSGFVPVVTDAEGNAIHPGSNWVFFAVTYDGTLTSQNLNYYFGTATNLATLDANSPQDYNKGIMTNTGPMAVGNLNTVTTLGGRTINGDNAAFFRGLIDELHIFSRVLTLQEIQQMQVAPALPAYLRLDNLVLSWEQGAQPLLPQLQLQSRSTVDSGTWTDVTSATNVSGSVRSIALPTTGNSQFFRLRSK